MAHHGIETAGEPLAPRELRLVGFGGDPERLHLLDEDGVGYTLDVTPALRAAVRGDASRPGRPARPGQLETTMDTPTPGATGESALRPRDIQARIRAGETPEQVAAAAGVPVEKVMTFAGPVLAEREHVGQRAQRATVRRPSAPAGGGDNTPHSRVLGDAVEGHLRGLDVDPTQLVWDARRREDGRWALTAAYSTSHRAGLGRFTYDVPGNYVIADDDDARWLLGELPVETTTAAPDDLTSARERRLATAAPLTPATTTVEPPAAPAAEEPLGADAIDLVSDPEPGPEEGEQTEALFEAHPAVPAAPAADTPAEAEPDPEPEPRRRPVQKKKGRASVPSWDEIMFGGGDRS